MSDIDELVPEDGDVAIVLRNHGTHGVCFVRHGEIVHKMSMEVADFGSEPDDLPMMVRRVEIKAGWTLKSWRVFRHGSPIKAKR